MLGITDLPTFIIGTILIVLLPGPNSLFVMSTAVRYGVKAGYVAAFGVYAGDLILILLTAFGAASLLQRFTWLFVVLKVIGAIYLTYLGIKLLIAAYHTWFSVQAPQTIEQFDFSEIKPFRTALTISILNPKAILFYLSFFIQFVDPKYSYPIIPFSILALILQIISMTYLSVLIFSGTRLAHYFSSHVRLSSICVALVGLLFLGFGLSLAGLS